MDRFNASFSRQTGFYRKSLLLTIPEVHVHPNGPIHSIRASFLFRTGLLARSHKKWLCFSASCCHGSRNPQDFPDLCSVITKFGTNTIGRQQNTGSSPAQKFAKNSKSQIGGKDLECGIEEIDVLTAGRKLVDRFASRLMFKNRSINRSMMKRKILWLMVKKAELKLTLSTITAHRGSICQTTVPVLNLPPLMRLTASRTACRKLKLRTSNLRNAVDQRIKGDSSTE